MSKYAGNKTEKNLMDAFAGESQARNKYTYASVAKKAGYEQMAALYLETHSRAGVKGVCKDVVLRVCWVSEHLRRTSVMCSCRRELRRDRWRMPSVFKGQAREEG